MDVIGIVAFAVFGDLDRHTAFIALEDITGFGHVGCCLFFHCGRHDFTFFRIFRS